MSSTAGSRDNALINWWDKVSMRLVKLLILLFAMFMFIQFMFLNQTLKTFLSRTDKLEGKSVADSELLIKTGIVELTFENENNLKLLSFYVNGEKVPSPAGKTIKLEVKNNDIIEISGSDFNDIAILRITSASENITVPEPGKVVYVNGNLVLVGRVKLR
ncbi:MAG: hypothetical protein ACM3TR_15700 [Caulobacteraceae bacterium]